MKIIAPDYYPEFVCIGGQCKHSCCIGWEIDIDAKSAERYRSFEGEWGNRLRQHMVHEPNGSHFQLLPNERCPFLNSEGLCDLILAFGEDVLCQICTDHPRFRHFYTARTEIGLGLCCEAACKLVLSKQEPVQWIVLKNDHADAENTDDENRFFRHRKRIFQILQDRRYSLAKRIETICFFEKINFEQLMNFPWFPFLSHLEQLDKQWKTRINTLHTLAGSLCSEYTVLETAFEQLLIYFLFRHLTQEGDHRIQISFAFMLLQLTVCLLKSSEHFTLDELCQIVRLLSSEIEYSTDNTSDIMKQIQKLIS